MREEAESEVLHITNLEGGDSVFFINTNLFQRIAGEVMKTHGISVTEDSDPHFWLDNIKGMSDLLEEKRIVPHKTFACMECFRGYRLIVEYKKANSRDNYSLNRLL